MITKEKLKEAKQFRTQMLWCGIISLPMFGVGLIFLAIYAHMNTMINEYESNLL